MRELLPDKADEGQNENEISMTEIRDVPTTTSHEEKANKTCESTTEAMLSHIMWWKVKIVCTFVCQIDLADIEAHALTYQADQVKAAQDANIMKIFLDGSLNKTLMLRVLAKKREYLTGTE